MYYLIKNLDSWNEKIHLKRSKIVAFVSSGFTGRERREFDHIFGKFASAFYKKVLFLYVNVDDDDLRKPFSEASDGLDVFPLVAVYDPDGNLIKKELNPPPKRFKDMIKLAILAGGDRKPFVIVTDKAHWEEMKRKPVPKAVAFVSDRLMGKEREEFDRMFREFAKAHKDEILFLYLVCDRDELWEVYDEVKPGGMHFVPLVATLDVNGTVFETYINPSPHKFRDMLKRVLEQSMPEPDVAGSEDEKEEENG